MNLSDLVKMTVPVHVKLERCIRSYSSKATCNQCVRFCPHNAIKLENGHVTVDMCDGCGKCIQACPHDVFEMDFPKALEKSAEGPLFLACKKENLQDLPVLSVGCLQQFTWLQLAILIRNFGKVYLFADDNSCQACEFQWFPEGQLALMERYGLKEFAERLHIIRERSELEALLEKEIGDINGRREYMLKQLESVKHVAKKYTEQSLSGYLSAFNEAWKNNTVVFEKTQSHALLLNELYEDCLDTEDVPIPLKTLSAVSCRYCRACERLCPWEAIAIIEEDGHAILAHHDILCARCGLCIDICPEKGLFWDRGLTKRDITDPHWRMLMQSQARSCSICGETFYPTSEEQTVCAFCKHKVS